MLQPKKLLLLMSILEKIAEWIKKRKGGKMELPKKTELWLMVVSEMVLAGMTILGYLNPETFARLVTLGASVYVAGRSLAKLTPTKKDDAIVEKLGEILEKLKK